MKMIKSTFSVSLVLYPSVTSSSEHVDATSQIGSVTSTDSYPIILVRETQTQVLMADGETIAIGGLLKDVKSEGIVKVPFLGDIPLIGAFFQRKTNDTEKVDLIIFITVNVISPARRGDTVMAEAAKDVPPEVDIDLNLTEPVQKEETVIPETVVPDETMMPEETVVPDETVLEEE